MRTDKRILAFLLIIAFVFSLCGCGDSGPKMPSEGSEFAVHFIDVGQADAALVICNGKTMLIDGGNTDSSNLMYSYLKTHNVKHLDYVVASHAHGDHVGGLPGALNYATVGKALCPVTDFDSSAFRNFVKYLAKRGVDITVPETGDTFMLGEAECTVLAVNTTDNEPNNTSIVLRIVYGETSFLFTGDAEREVELALSSSGFELESTVLKVGHHGSYSSTSYVFLRNVMPKYAVISVGRGNDYGHPTPEVLSRLRDAEVKVFRTDKHGTVICTSDGKNLIFGTEKTPKDDVMDGIGSNSVTTDSGRDYVANKSSMKFHYPDCASVSKMSKENRLDFHGKRDELITQGYDPCGSCKP